MRDICPERLGLARRFRDSKGIGTLREAPALHYWPAALLHDSILSGIRGHVD